MKPRHHAFKLESTAILTQLRTHVVVYPSTPDREPPTGQGKKYDFIWDTGASGSVITPRVATEIGLIEIGRKQICAVNGEHVVPVYMVDIRLPMEVGIKHIEVTGADITGADGLIGMDIIAQGDFSISNYGGKTIFTFAIPPFENRADHLEKANAVNLRNKV